MRGLDWRGSVGAAGSRRGGCKLEVWRAWGRGCGVGGVSRRSRGQGLCLCGFGGGLGLRLLAEVAGGRGGSEVEAEVVEVQMS